MIDDDEQHEQRSSVCFERTAKGVITPKVKVYSHDAEPAVLDNMLDQAKRLFVDSLVFAEDKGAKPA